MFKKGILIEDVQKQLKTEIFFKTKTKSNRGYTKTTSD